MMKIAKALSLVIFLLGTLLSLIGCEEAPPIITGGEGQNEPKQTSALTQAPETKVMHTVVFDLNDGSGQRTTVQIMEGDTITGYAPQLDYGDREVIGWSISQEGDTYADRVTGDLTLYAQWLIHTPTVYLNGGVMNVSENATLIEIVAQTPTRDDHAFIGWFSDFDLTKRIDPKNVTSEQKKASSIYAGWLYIGTMTYDVRSDVATITDSGRDNQKYDTVNLFLDYDLGNLAYNGYSFFRVTVNMELCEVNDGYQYVFLYNTDKTSSTELYEYEYEHGSGQKDTNWGHMTFTALVSISDLDRNLYIRYGAAGKDDDTWKNKNIQITVTPIRG